MQWLAARTLDLWTRPELGSRFDFCILEMRLGLREYFSFARRVQSSSSKVLGAALQPLAAELP